jgi:hypothetical protein
MRNRALIIITSCLTAMLFFSGALANAQPQEEPPYTGVIQNKTKYTISVPSANSGATLIIPPKGNMEYVTWSPDFQFIAYVDGKPFFCQQIKVVPKNYQYMCKAYDFLAEVQTDEAASKPKPARKLKRRYRS